MELSNYKEDKTAIEDGRWFEIGSAKIKLRSLASEKSKTYRRDLEKKEFTKYRLLKEEVPASVLESTLYRQLVDVIILDWEGIKLDGEEFPYTKENATKLLNDYSSIRDRIAAIVSDDLSFTHKYSEDATKN